MLEEFKKFALRGNVVDLAVGVIIGVAFGAIVTSLVNDIIMPIFKAITGHARLGAVFNCSLEFSHSRICVVPGDQGN